MKIGMPFFLNEIDTDTRKKILELDHKLKTLRAEVELKLNEAEESHLPHLMQDIEQAIRAITPVVTLVVDE